MATSRNPPSNPGKSETPAEPNAGSPVGSSTMEVDPSWLGEMLDVSSSSGSNPSPASQRKSSGGFESSARRSSDSVPKPAFESQAKSSTSVQPPVASAEAAKSAPKVPPPLPGGAKVIPPPLRAPQGASTMEVDPEWLKSQSMSFTDLPVPPFDEQEPTEPGAQQAASGELPKNKDQK